VYGEIDLDADRLRTMDWREACTTIAQTMFDVLSRHKNLAPLLVHQIPSGPNAMRLRELAIAVLLDNGFPPRLAGRSYATLAHYVLGFAMQLGGPDTAATSPPTGLADVDAAQFPATAAAAASLPVALEDEFTFGLELIVTGLGSIHSG
jgi:TetR/AcrR family tetracycline transcriptional repressor